ncbi:MAG TPA: hypothetical protein VME17_15610 [Bryobacteraceae bacterium]|nr:hypothetical protein [Bryobacteraceae bacterium]
MLEFVLYVLSGFGYALYYDLNFLEIGLVAAALLFAYRGWTPTFSILRPWRAWVKLAYQRKTAVAVVFFSALAIRAALLPVLPVPHPEVTDEFSQLLLADTLAHGRLTNPTHPMWPHFESIHIIQKPTYNSDYFPGPAAILSLGMRAGHPWIAVWLLCAAMCAAFCWMLQAWAPPAWALFGALLAVVRFDIASYWINSYYGGCLAALGGALILGAYPRFLKKPSILLSLVLAFGIIAVGYSRPFEGLAVCVPVIVALGIAFRKRLRVYAMCIPATALVLAAIAGLLVYCKAVTGDPFRTPYAVNQAAYGWPLGLPWFHARDVKLRDVEMQRYYDYEREAHDRNSSLLGELKHSTQKAQTLWRFYLGPALSIPLVMLPAVWRSRRLRLLFLAAGGTLLLALIQFVSLPHYAAPAAAAILAILVECMRRLHRFRHNGRPIGLQLVLAAPAIMLVILAVRITLQEAHLPFTQANNFESWCCAQPGNQNKARILAILEKAGGKHLVIVEPKTNPQDFLQWIYNAADIDQSQVVWARDFGRAGNRALIDYFHGRSVWLVDPNTQPARITPYPGAQ